MQNHIDELLQWIPDLLGRKTLDLGCGRGDFIIEVKKKDGNIIGVEPYQLYVEETRKKLADQNFLAEILQGGGESLPFEDNRFGFINMNEVIEHTADPVLVMEEVYRVLNKNGKVYLSVPNRHGLKDQHFGLYFVNWLPRFLANPFISVFGKHKNYNNTAGRQRLDHMHYYRYGQIKKILEDLGFKVQDIRELKIKEKFDNFLIKNLGLFVYKPLRFMILDSFHLLLSK